MEANQLQKYIDDNLYPKHKANKYIFKYISGKKRKEFSSYDKQDLFVAFDMLLDKIIEYKTKTVGDVYNVFQEAMMDAMQKAVNDMIAEMTDAVENNKI